MKQFDPTSQFLGITDAELREEETRIGKKPAPGDPFGGIREMIREGRKSQGFRENHSPSVSHSFDETQQSVASQKANETQRTFAKGQENGNNNEPPSR